MNHLRVIRDTLRPQRETVVDSMVDRGGYGFIESFHGEIVIEVLPTCYLPLEEQEVEAMRLAVELVPHNVEVHHWNLARIADRIILTPSTWTESEPTYSGFRRE